MTEFSGDGMSSWFAEMSARELLFHPENSPREVINIADGQPTFTDDECAELEQTLSTMFDAFGDKVMEAAYPIFMKKAGLLSALDS